MKRTSRQISRELNSNGPGITNAPLELPAADEYDCTDEEVRQICEEFQDFQTFDGTS
jgi:hypothetical protein